MEVLYEIRDLRDELYMLKSLAEDQETVWQQAFGSNHPKGNPSEYPFYTPTEVKQDLSAMMAEARNIENYVSEPSYTPYPSPNQSYR
jgi:hypothetical protein